MHCKVISASINIFSFLKKTFVYYILASLFQTAFVRLLFIIIFKWVSPVLYLYDCPGNFSHKVVCNVKINVTVDFVI